MSILKTLTAKRVKVTEGHYKGFYETHLFNESGKLVGKCPAYGKQPHANKKTIVHNCFTYKLKFEGVQL